MNKSRNKKFYGTVITAEAFISKLIILTSSLLAQTSLRNILGTKNLHEILSDRESIALAMQVKLKRQRQHTSRYFKTILDEATTAWGIKVERVEM